MTDVNVLVAFYSPNGSTEALANAVAEGARAKRAQVRLRGSREIVTEQIMAKAPGWIENAKHMNQQYEAPSGADAEWTDAIILGTATRFGNISFDLKANVDSLSGLWFQGKLVGKVGSAFTSTSTPHDGNESTSISMYNFMAHLGLIIVPLGYGDTKYVCRRKRPTECHRCRDRATRHQCHKSSRLRISRDVAHDARALKTAGETRTK